jgi:dihydrofolate reductase
MPKLCVRSFSISLDGFGAGPDQDLEHPVGVGGLKLHQWIFATRSFGAMRGGADEGETGVDDDFVAHSDDGIGASIMGRNMFGPIRGPWPDETWTGWWGDEPPFHHPVFVLTHHPRRPIEMKGGTTFHFVSDGIDAALERAFEAARGQDVRLGGGVTTIQQYLRAGLIDELQLVLVPVLLGTGERLFESIADAGSGFECVELACSPYVAHVRLVRKGT